MPPSSESGRKLGLVNSLGGRGKGTPSLPSSAVSKFSGVRQRGVAEGLRGVGVIVEVEVARRVDARFAVGQVQGQGLALRDVAVVEAPRLKTFV